MGPKADPNQVVYLTLRVTGGEAPSGAAIAPKLGALGLPVKKVGEDIMKATAQFKGLRTMVRLKVQNRQATIEILPSTTRLLIGALKEPVRDRKKEKNIKHHGNLKLEEVFDIARQMRHKSYSKEFSGTVKEILGTANSLGCTINKCTPTEIIAKINSGELEVPAA